MLFFPKYGTSGVDGVCAAAVVAEATSARQAKTRDAAGTGRCTRVRISSTSGIHVHAAVHARRPDGNAWKPSDLTVTVARLQRPSPGSSPILRGCAIFGRRRCPPAPRPPDPCGRQDYTATE